MFKVILIISAVFLNVAEPANILFFSAVGSPSMRISVWPLLEALSDKGHSVTYLSGSKDLNTDLTSKIKSYEPSGLVKLNEKILEWEDVNLYESRKSGYIHGTEWLDIFKFGVVTCESLYEDGDFVKWMKLQKFDLVIIEMFMNECAYGMIPLWGGKYAVYSTGLIAPGLNDIFGLPDESSSTTDVMFGFSGRDKMAFWQRFINAVGPVVMGIIRENYYLPKLEEVTRKYLGENVKSFSQVEREASLLFLSTHFSTDDARSFPPNVIPIGGVVIKKQIPLDGDLEQFMNECEKGFIYISFGTAMDFQQAPEDVQRNFVEALSSFSETRFVWQLGKDLALKMELPKNVMMAKWVPQQTILGHNEIKAFITHCGMGSTIEAIHFSVPVITIPIAYDQDLNADMIVRRRAGVKVEIVDLKREHLEEAIMEILYNKSYREGMTRLTNFFKDQPTSPLERGVWWIEYLLRHDNPNEYLLSPNVNQEWWKKRQIDVWIAAASIVLIPILIVASIMYFIIKRIKSVLSNCKAEKIKVN